MNNGSLRETASSIAERISMERRVDDAVREIEQEFR
jgi:hypothetical protein